MGEQLSDDMTVEDVEDDISISVSSSGQIVSDNGIGAYFSSGFVFLSQYGWYLVIVAVILLYVWNKYKSSYYNWKQKRQDWIDEQNFDPVKAEKYQDGMMKSRERMQQKLNRDAEIHLAKEEEKAKKEQDERIKQWEEFKVINKSKAKQNSRSGGRRDFLPLGGGGGGGGYRAPRRQLGGGGG